MAHSEATLTRTDLVLSGGRFWVRYSTQDGVSLAPYRWSSKTAHHAGLTGSSWLTSLQHTHTWNLIHSNHTSSFIAYTLNQRQGPACESDRNPTSGRDEMTLYSHHVHFFFINVLDYIHQIGTLKKKTLLLVIFRTEPPNPSYTPAMGIAQAQSLNLHKNRYSSTYRIDIRLQT